MKWSVLGIVFLCLSCLLGAEEFDAGKYALKHWSAWKTARPVIRKKPKPGKGPDKEAFFLECVRKYAPHWIEEFAAVDRAFGWEEGTYAKMCALGIHRPEPAHECTSWIVMPELTGGKYMMLHKNRDSSSKHLAVVRCASKGKHAWIGLGDFGFMYANMGINDAGLAVGMNSGSRSKAETVAGLGTTWIARILLEETAAAADAVALLEKIVAEKAYHHGKSGSIWFIADAKESFIVEHDADYFKAAPVQHGLAVRANVWNYPEMAKHATTSTLDFLSNNYREDMLRQKLIGDVFYTKYNIEQHDVAAASRLRRMVDECVYPLCGSRTNSAATFTIDTEFPDILSTAWLACGPIRSTVYIPVPAILENIPDDLLNGSFSNAAFRAAAKQGLDSSIRKFVEIEQKMTANHEKALSEARALLRRGGGKGAAAALLAKSFADNWKLAQESREQPAVKK